MKHPFEHQLSMIAVRVVSYIVASMVVAAFADVTLMHATRMLS